MKKIILIAMTSLTMAGCYKEDITPINTSSPTSNTGNSSGSAVTSHYCGYPTKKGTPCQRLVSGSSGYCWQHK